MLAVSAFIFFQVGVRYEQIAKHRQEILVFANVASSQILIVNRIIESFGSKSKDEIILDFNNKALESIGCSLWLDHLNDFEDKEKEKELFFTAIDMALEKVGFPNDVFHSDDKCINNLLDMRGRSNLPTATPRRQAQPGRATIQ